MRNLITEKMQSTVNQGICLLVGKIRVSPIICISITTTYLIGGNHFPVFDVLSLQIHTPCSVEEKEITAKLIEILPWVEV